MQSKCSFDSCPCCVQIRPTYTNTSYKERWGGEVWESGHREQDKKAKVEDEIWGYDTKKYQ